MKSSEEDGYPAGLEAAGRCPILSRPDARGKIQGEDDWVLRSGLPDMLK